MFSFLYVLILPTEKKFQKNRESQTVYSVLETGQNRGENTGNCGSSCKNLGCTAVFSAFTAVFLDRGFDRFLKPNKRSDFRGLLKPRFF
jgi:hypothetical protein